MSKSWRACSSLLARSFPPASSEMLMGPAAASDLPGQTVASHGGPSCLELIFCYQLRVICAALARTNRMQTALLERDQFELCLVFQDGIHGEVRGHNSAFQWQIHQDSTRNTRCVECFFCIIETWYCCKCWSWVCFLPHCDQWIHSLVWPVAFSVPTEPLLCKFADGGQKKRQNQSKYLHNGRPWARDGDTVTSFFLSSKILEKNHIKYILESFEFNRPHSVLADCFSTYCTGVCMTSLVLNPFFVFPGRNDACIWPHSLTKWVSGMHGLTKNSPSPPGK